MKTVLVTGAGGYIGCILTPKLLKKGYHVKAVDRFFFGKEKLSDHPNLEKIQADTRCLDTAHFENIYGVIDLVAVSNDPSGEAFDQATREINHSSRVRTATLAKAAGAKRYILPSSCSIYGFQDDKVDESAPTNPLTTYAQSNERAETEVLDMHSKDFVVSVMRQATVYGYSPRMRFDLAINGMTYGAWKTQRLPLMRDGTQYRPMVHVQDTTDVMCLLLEADATRINGEIFNVGGESQNYQIGPLGESVAQTVGNFLGKPVEVEWYGDPDHRSYNVSFDKIKTVLNWEPKWDAEKGAQELLEKLASGALEKTEETITLNWYKELERWFAIINDACLHGGMLNLPQGDSRR